MPCLFRQRKQVDYILYSSNACIISFWQVVVFELIFKYWIFCLLCCFYRYWKEGWTIALCKVIMQLFLNLEFHNTKNHWYSTFNSQFKWHDSCISKIKYSSIPNLYNCYIPGCSSSCSFGFSRLSLSASAASTSATVVMLLFVLRSDTLDPLVSLLRNILSG